MIKREDLCRQPALKERKAIGCLCGLAIGDYATVYYNGDSPTEANIYSVEVSGRLYDDADDNDGDNDDDDDGDDSGGDTPHPWLYSSNG